MPVFLFLVIYELSSIIKKNKAAGNIMYKRTYMSEKPLSYNFDTNKTRII